MSYYHEWPMSPSFEEERKFHLKYAYIFFVGGILMEIARQACLLGNLRLLASIDRAFALLGFFLMFVCLCKALIAHLNYRENLRNRNRDCWE